jgi:hypothetical protein
VLVWTATRDEQRILRFGVPLPKIFGNFDLPLPYTLVKGGGELMTTSLQREERLHLLLDRVHL